MVHVAHDGDHGSALLEVLDVFGVLDRLHSLDFVGHGGGGGAELAGHFGGQLGIQGLVDHGEDAAIQQFLDNQVGLNVQFLGKLLDRDAFRNGDFAIDGRGAGFYLAARGTQDPFLLDALAGLLPYGTLIAGPAATGDLGTGRRRHAGLHTAARSGMLRTRSSGTPGGHAGTHARLGDHGLAGANGTAINRLPGDRRRRRLGNSGPGGYGRRRHDWPGRAELGSQVGPWRHHRTRGRLSGQRARGLSGARSWRGAAAGLAKRLGASYGSRRALRRRGHAGQSGARAFGGAPGRTYRVERMPSIRPRLAD